MGSTHVLVLSPLRESSGNYTTAHRIGDYFSGDGFTVSFRDPKHFTTVQEFKTFTCINQVNVVIAIHAYHTSAALKTCSLPIILVFGGTDINEFSKTPEHYETMSKIINKSEFLVAFSQEMARSALQVWPMLETNQVKLKVIPQGVLTKSSGYDLQNELKQHTKRNSGAITYGAAQDDVLIFTLVAGIRPVKDPMYLLDVFSNWHDSSRPNAYLVVIGPLLDQDFGAKFLQRVKHLPGVVYLGTLCEAESHAAIRASTALVNSSLSEGNSMAILEALILRTPVIARDIAGNRGLITDGTNGFLYTTPQEFIEKAELLISTDGLRETLTENGINSVKAQHSSDAEGDAYRRLITSVLKI